MRREVLKKLAIVITLVLVGFIVLFAFPAEADKSQVEFEASVTVPANSYQYKTTPIYVPAVPESVHYVASFDVPSGEIVKFYPFDQALFELWQEGKFQLSWVEGSHGDFGMGISSETDTSFTLYLVVQNGASSSVDVNVRLSKVWHESNKSGWFAGSAIVSLGVAMLPVLMFGRSRLHFGYSAIIFAMTFILVSTLAWAPYQIYPQQPALILWAVTEAIPGMLFLEAFPLAILLYLLQRNNGFAYFKNWNVGKRLQIAGICLISGFIIPLVFMVLRMASLLLYWPINPDELTTFSVAVGGLFMFIGLIFFAELWAIHHQRRCLSAAP